jgi:MFS family permease
VASRRRSVYGLDGFVFFVADVLTAFGPFVAVYLTSQHWPQLDIGLVLTIAGLVALAGQMPGGALVDAARSERRLRVSIASPLMQPSPNGRRVGIRIVTFEACSGAERPGSKCGFSVSRSLLH